MADPRLLPVPHRPLPLNEETLSNGAPANKLRISGVRGVVQDPAAVEDESFPPPPPDVLVAKLTLRYI